ncbi:hypothetical protein C2845_PM17G03310 [Panicum miliaceum]|uniref:DUF1618 domain-containing protein n=1 Tax=Panicum miliaceum TaxID=4540 RepID=A0A3L6Q5X6_PANMI|nr:hypothetical protein C2845_PM17G03310 [Panicum miliaceum]
METVPHPTEPADDTTVAADPRCVLLSSYGCRRGDASVAGDAMTVADSFTSTGWRFRVSFGLAPPPASSCLNYRWLGAGPPGGDTNDRPTVIAAHVDCVLFELRTPQLRREGYGGYDRTNLDYFLYEAGAARPPSLLLLPACYIPKQYERRGDEARRPEKSARMLFRNDTAVLRRGEGDHVVAQLEVSYGDAPKAFNPVELESPDYASRIHAELCVLRTGSGDWELVQAVRIVYDADMASGGGARLMRDWETEAAFPASDRFLCFVDYLRGVLLCDTAADMGTLRYVPLPVEVPDHVWGGERDRTRGTRSLSAAAGAAGCAVWFVSIDPRCCCGGPGTTWCARGRFAFPVTTWTLSLSAGAVDEPATWVKDSVLDCEEVWAFPAFRSIPRVRLENPVVSSDDPDVKVWMVKVNMRSKEMLSAFPCTPEPWRAESNVPVKLKWSRAFA